MVPTPTPPVPPEILNENKRKSPPPSLTNPASKRQRLDSPSSRALRAGGGDGVDEGEGEAGEGEREDSLSSLSPDANGEGEGQGGSLASPVQSEEVEVPGGGVAGKGPAIGRGGGGAGGQKSRVVVVPPLRKDQEEEEDSNDDEEEEEEDIVLPIHHELSAKTLPNHQPRPADLVLNANGNTNGTTNGNANGNGNGNANGTGRTTVGGKGQRGEEQLQHAVAAREEIERRRIENKQERFTGAPPPPPPSAASTTSTSGTNANGGTNATAAMKAMKATLMGMVSNGSNLKQVVNVKVEDEELVRVESGVVVDEDEDEDLGGPPVCHVYIGISFRIDKGRVAIPLHESRTDVTFTLDGMTTAQKRKASSQRRKRQPHPFRRSNKRQHPFLSHHPNRSEKHFPKTTPEDAARIYRPISIRSESL